MKTPVEEKERGTTPEAHTGNGAAPEVLPPVRQRETAKQDARAGGFGIWDALWLIPRGFLRLFFPKLLDRYVMGELLVPLAFGWTLFIVLFVFSVNLFKLAQMAARGAPLGQVGEMLYLRVILASVMCLPMAMLLSGLLAFGRLSGDSELIAIQAGGIPNIRIILNAFILGLVLSIGGIAINEYIIPPMGKRLHYLEDLVKKELKGQMISDLTDQKAFVIQDFEGGQLARVCLARKFTQDDDKEPAKMEDVTYVQYDHGKVATVVQAKKAIWIGPEKTGATEQKWRFFDATTQMMAQVTNNQRWIMHSDETDLTLNKSPQQVAREQKDADQMTYAELKKYINDLYARHAKSRVIREMEVELERKLAIPFASLVLALVGAPLGIRRHRSSTGVGVGLSLLIIIVYYIGMSFMGALGENGQMSAQEAAWGCNVVGLAVGLFLTWRSSR